MRTTDFSKYSDGKHIIDEDLMHVIVSTYTTENGTEKLFEAHRKYIDIQFMIRGRESIYWSPLENLSPVINILKMMISFSFKGSISLSFR